MELLTAGGALALFGSSAAAAQEDDSDETGTAADWLPTDASEAHVAVLSGNQADVGTDAGGCAHVTPQPEENTLVVDLVLEDIACVTQAHIHEGERGEDGPVVAPLLQYTEEVDGSGSGAPLTTDTDTPLIAGATVDDADLVEDILANPSGYYVNVHTAHNPAGEIRGQLRGFDSGQETDIEPEPAEFTVSDLEPQDATVVQGDSVDVSVTVYNDGDETDSQTVQLAIDDEVVAEQALELDCRRSSTVTFEDVDTGGLDPDEYVHSVSTEDDSATGSLRVLSPPEFVVSDLDPQDVTVTQGDLIEVSATVENAGEATGTQTVEFRVDDAPIAEQQLELDGGESEPVTFADIDTADLDPSEYEHGVFTDDDSETATLTVEAPTPAQFVVSELTPEDVTVTQGDVIDVSATVENVGQSAATQPIEFRIDDQALLDQELELEGGASSSVTFDDVDTADLDPGEYEHGIYSADDGETATLTLEAPEAGDGDDDEAGDGDDGEAGDDDGAGDGTNGDDENGDGEDGNGDGENGNGDGEDGNGDGEDGNGAGDDGDANGDDGNGDGETDNGEGANGGGSGDA